MTENYLDLEPLLIARLKAKVTDALEVMSAADLAAVEGQTLRTPSLQVFYTGDSFAEDADHSRHLEVNQTWTVIVAVRHIAGASAVRNEAGELMAAVIAALQGWHPSPAHDALARVQGPYPVYADSGFAYFPLSFSCRVLTSGDIS